MLQPGTHPSNGLLDLEHGSKLHNWTPPFFLEVAGFDIPTNLGVDGEFFATIVLFNTQLFPGFFGWFPEKMRIRGKNGHGRYL